tara:strand:- start:125 stop:508 length:384 start_codon:yes stop_codon:yes gene_type:complete
MTYKGYCCMKEIERCDTHEVDYRGQCPICRHPEILATLYQRYEAAKKGIYRQPEPTFRTRIPWTPALGRRLRQIRERQGWTRHAFVREKKIANGTLFAAESGQSTFVLAGTLEKIAAALGVDVAALT